MTTSFSQLFTISISVAFRRLWMMRIQSSICLLLGLLFLAVTSGVHLFYLVQPTSNLIQQNHLQRTLTPPLKNALPADNQSVPSWSNESSSFLKRIDALLGDKKTLEIRVDDCQHEKTSLVTLLESNQKTNEKLLIDKIQLLEHEKNQTQHSIQNLKEERKVLQVVHREFFNYAAAMLHDTPYPGVENYSRYTVARLGMSHLTGIEPLKPEYGPVINNVTLFSYPITISPCQNGNVSIKQNSIFIAVISAPGNFDKRNTIRRTWRNHLKVDYHKSSMSLAGFAFILGLTDHNETQMKIEQEATTYGDVIQIEMADFYRNLSLKVAGLFNWLYKYCHHKIDFLFKVDDDVYVNVRNLVQFVQTFHESNESMFGLSAVSSLKPIRDDGKWGISLEEWPWNHYPGYYLGPAVLFSGRTILLLLAAFQTTPMMPFDDIYVTGMCAEKAGLNRTNFSSHHTTVYSMSQPAVPLACDLRRLISWLTESAAHMNNSHVSTDDFYLNRTQCVIAGTNGTTKNITIDHNEPVQFHLV